MNKKEEQVKTIIELAKRDLHLISDRMKEIQKRNKIPNRKGKEGVLRYLFNKYHKGKFTLNKVRHIGVKKVLGDAGEYFQLMMRNAWLKGFMTAKLKPEIKWKSYVKNEKVFKY